MALTTETLFGIEDKVALSILRLREFEKQAIAMSPDGYWLAFSGGKDSTVIYDLAKRAGVKHTVHFNVTTVDPPELIRFIKDNYKDVKWEKPEKTMFDLWVEKMMPPTRIVRYCCGYLKERGGSNHFVITGIRWAESARRSKRMMTEACFRNSRKRYLHPIIEWTDADVWEYIKLRNLPHCCLYDEGHTRIGCVGCPMSGKKGMERDFARWPRIRARYAAAAAAAAAARLRLGNHYGKQVQIGEMIPTGDFDEDDNEIMIPATEEDVALYAKHKRKLRWSDGEAMMKWWLCDSKPIDDPDQGVLFE